MIIINFKKIIFFLNLVYFYTSENHDNPYFMFSQYSISLITKPNDFVITINFFDDFSKFLNNQKGFNFFFNKKIAFIY